MELPSTQALKLMKPNVDWIDEFYREAIPDGVDIDPNKTICIVSEWLNRPIYYANATFKGWEIGVEVHIFYSLTSTINALNEEIKLARMFVKDNWTVEQSQNHSKDPDTQQVDKVFYFAKELILKESEIQ